jgi:hypothetical protein
MLAAQRGAAAGHEPDDLERHRVVAAELADADRPRPERPGDDLLRRQPAEQVDEPRRHVDGPQSAGPGEPPRDLRVTRSGRPVLSQLRDDHDDLDREDGAEYVGTDTGRLWKTEDGGANWTWFDSQGLPERWVSRVAIDPTDEDTVYATFSGFRNGEDAAHVFRTTNGGTTWNDISGNLPNAPVNDVVIDKERSTVYVGSDVGVFYLKNGKKNWKPVGEGLPLAPVLDLRLHAPSDTLYTNTFGRSMWMLGLED